MILDMRHRLGLYCHFHFTNLTQFEVAAFLRLLLRHLREHHPAVGRRPDSPRRREGGGKC